MRIIFIRREIPVYGKFSSDGLYISVRSERYMTRFQGWDKARPKTVITS